MPGVTKPLTVSVLASRSEPRSGRLLVARLEVMGEIDARGAIRFRVDSATTLRGMDGKPFDVTVENFSRTGFLFVADVDLPVGTLVSVGLSGAGVREAK